MTKKLTRSMLRRIILNEIRSLNEQEEDGLEKEGMASYEDAITLSGPNKRYISSLIKTGLKLQIRKKQLGSVSGSTRVLVYVVSKDSVKVSLLDHEDIGTGIDSEELEQFVNRSVKKSKMEQYAKSVPGGVSMKPGKTYRYLVQFQDVELYS